MTDSLAYTCVYSSQVLTMNWTRVCAQVISDSHVAAGKKYTTARACFMVHSDIPRVQLCQVRISRKNYEALCG